MTTGKQYLFAISNDGGGKEMSENFEPNQWLTHCIRYCDIDLLYQALRDWDPSGLRVFKANSHLSELSNKHLFFFTVEKNAEEDQEVIVSMKPQPNGPLTIFPIPGPQKWAISEDDATGLLWVHLRDTPSPLVVPDCAQDDPRQKLFSFLCKFVASHEEARWSEVRRNSQTLLSLHSHWTLGSTQGWHEEGAEVFLGEAGSKPDPGSVVDAVVFDIRKCDDWYLNVLYNGVFVLEKGKPADEASWEKRREDLCNVVERCRPTLDLKKASAGKLDIIGYALSPCGTAKLAGDSRPFYADLPADYKWRHHTGSECQKIVVNATRATHITNAHNNGPGMDVMVWHVCGQRLWVVWESNLENLKNYWDASDKEPTLGWCLRNLSGAKVYMVGLNECEPMERFVVQGGSIHFAISFAPCLSLSSAFFHQEHYHRNASYMKAAIERLEREDAWNTKRAWWKDYNGALTALEDVQAGWKEYFSSKDESVPVDLKPTTIPSSLKDILGNHYPHRCPAPVLYTE